MGKVLNAEFARAVNELAEMICKGLIRDRQTLEREKIRVSKRYKLSRIPGNAQILNLLGSKGIDISLLRRKPARFSSGIYIFSVMCRPWPCPKKEPCYYCPGGAWSYFGSTPQSYTGREPAALRAIQNSFNPYEQVRKRLKQLKAIGHSPSKVELIVQGGTFPSMPRKYQEWFIKRCLDGLVRSDSHTLSEAVYNSEKAEIRNTGITVESRPETMTNEEIRFLLKAGVTRVEIGVQSVFNDILAKVNRGHGIEDVKKCFRRLKDYGLKVTAHMMPGLPGSNFKRDLESFKILFEDKDLRPDGLKIYPTLVLRGTKIYDSFKRGEYTPPSLDETIRLLATVKTFIPTYVRIYRIQRDIPAPLIEGGVKKSNLRQLVWRYMSERGLRCRCIRCREVGRYILKGGSVEDLDPKLVRLDYEASGGEEIFLSFEDTEKDILIGFLRLRILPERNEGYIRELHVYGFQLGLGEKPIKTAAQHRGYGKRLVELAEKISIEEYNIKVLRITSGIGVREYYRRLGYKYESPYMVKKF